jgi:Icc-related predicted phosphoesterase
MATILVLGDLHLSDRPPANCTESYQDDLFDLLYQIVNIATSKKCAAVVQAGDFFHSKIPGRTSHRTIARALDWVQALPCPVFITPGNHDVSHDRVESLDEGQPLGVILRGGAHLLIGWADQADERVADLRVPLYGVPWLQEWNDRDPEAGGPSIATRAAVERATADWRSRWDGSVPALCITHAPFYPPGLELEFEHYPVTLFAEALGRVAQDGAASVYYGHVHEAHGQYVAGAVQFCNQGALSRGSIVEHDLTRELAITLWDTVTGKFTRVPLAHRPAAEVFRLTEVAQIAQRQVDLDTFLASIGESSLEITSVAAVLEHVRGLNLGAEIEAIIEELLEGART